MGKIVKRKHFVLGFKTRNDLDNFIERFKIKSEDFSTDAQILYLHQISNEQIGIAVTEYLASVQYTP